MSEMGRIWLAAAIVLTFLNSVTCLIKCPASSGPAPAKQDASVSDFGEPVNRTGFILITLLAVMLITTASQNFSPYSWVDTYRSTSTEDEYLMVGYYEIPNSTVSEDEHEPPPLQERIQMLMFDRVKIVDADADDVLDLVHQNLEKELYWKYFNMSGILPQGTIANSTMRKNILFQADVLDNKISPIVYTANLEIRQHYWEPQVPYTVVFEIPSNSRALRKEMTLIEYQSFTLWRWKLGETVKTWPEIVSSTDENDERPTSTNFYKIDNPCIKDMFLMFTPRSERGNPKKKLVYLASPLIQTQFQENFFYDMNAPDQPWSPESPQSIVLTNDHLVVLTEKGLWISASLNNTPDDLTMQGNYADRPQLTYTKVNPCELYDETIECFTPEKTPDIRQPEIMKSTKHRLFYTPVCYLNQFPYYDDYLILVTERMRSTVSNGKALEMKDFTVMFAPRPYDVWSVLFSVVGTFLTSTSHSKGQKEGQVIDEIIGIIFNHHRRQFDITLEVVGKENMEFLRFALPDPPQIFDGYGVQMTKEEIEETYGIPVNHLNVINSTVGDGFSEFRFPGGFMVTDVLVAGDALDLFFVGNQLWIAEAAGTSVYLALSKLTQPNPSTFCNDIKQQDDTGKIKECSFNHPDKTFVCTNENRRLLLAGKVGSQYTINVFEVEHITELINTQRVSPWPMKYYCDLLQMYSIFVAGFSGRIILWFVYDPDLEAKSVQTEIGGGCHDEKAEPELCDDIKRWNQKGCTVEKSGTIAFALVAIDPRQLSLRQDSCDGALVPFLVDANTAILYEAIVPGDQHYAYFDETYVGRQIFCMDYELLKTDLNDNLKRTNCELFVRHIKPIEDYLDGFKKAIYVTIVRSIPLLPLPVDVVVLVHANSNKALVQINGGSKFNPPWQFTEEQIGQTLYVPGNFSMLLQSFPRGQSNPFLMEGYITRHFQRQRRFVFQAFGSYLMDMSTKMFREKIISSSPDIEQETHDRWKKTDDENTKKWNAEVQMRTKVQALWEQSEFADKTIKLYKYDLQSDVPITTQAQEDELLVAKPEESSDVTGSQTVSWPPRDLGDPDLLMYGITPYNEKLVWYVDEEECHYVMSLIHNAVLITPGGRISLDLYDRISFEVTLRPLTALGKLLTNRHLLDVTNSNPEILRVDMEDKVKGSPQFIQFLLSPTGFSKGTAVVTVRSRVNSLKCPYLSSVTFTVLCHREVGRRLHVVYPVPTCPPDEKHGLFQRPWWYKPEKGCISTNAILHDDEIIIEKDGVDTLIYQNLEVNYRPPSHDGESSPLSRNVYNADPSQPAYKDLYVASKESLAFGRCAGATKKSECRCGEASHKILDDEQFAECKEKAFLVNRADPIRIKILYDRIMRDQDQNPSMFIPKRNWSVSIEEVNGREEWFITMGYSPYINEINEDAKLHRGQMFYDMSNLTVVLVGTGLFHFKAQLGQWESFDPVIGYFMLYSSTEELNHIHMVMIVFGTIILCVTFVFIGFVVHRKRLQAMLPSQPLLSHKKKMKLL